MSESEIVAKLATSGLSDELKKQIGNIAGVEISTATLSASQKGATASTLGLSTAFKGLWATLMANPLILVGAGIMAGIAGFNAWKHSQDELAQATKSAAQEAQSASQSINDYAEKYKALHDELTNANTTEERQVEIKKELLSIQTELNDKYGDEYGRINLVTDAYKDQTDAIKKYNKEAANSYLNKHRKGIEDATKQMTKLSVYNLSPTGISKFDDKGIALQDIVSQFADKGISATPNESGEFIINLKANPTDAYDTINDFENLVREKAKELGDEHLFDDVLEWSSMSLIRADKTISEYGESFKQGLIAQIVSDDTLSAKYEEMLNVVKKYNDAVRNSSNPYDDKKVEESLEQLRQVKTEIEGDTDTWGKFASITNDIFSQADTALLDFDNKLKNTFRFQNLITAFKGLSETEVRAFENAKNNEGFNELIEEADNLGLGINDVIDALIRMGIIQEDVSKKDIFPSISKQGAISNVNSLSEGFEALDKIMASIKGDNPFDYALLDDKKFTESFSGMGKAYTDFIETVSNSPKDINACQGAFNKLVTEFLTQSVLSKTLTDDTEALTAAMLKNQGVTNSEAVAHDLLIQAKANAIICSSDLSNATQDEINALISEAGVADEARESFYAYIAQKLLDQVINTGGDIEQLNNVMTTLGLATSAWQKYYAAKQQLAKFGDPKKNAAGEVYYEYTETDENGRKYNRIASELSYNQLVKETEREQNDIAQELENKAKNVTANYGGGTKANKPSGGRSGNKSKKDVDNTIDWIDRYLALLDKKRSELDSLANSSFTSYFGLTDDEFARATEILNKSDALTTDDLQELAEMASNAKMSISDLYTLIQTGENTDSKRGLLDSIIQNDKDRLSVLEQAISKYKQQYDELKKSLDDETIFKIENGGIQIEDYSEDEKSQIEKVQSAYDKLTDKQRDYSDTKLKLFEDTKQPYENEIAYMDNQTELLNNQNNLIESRMNYLNASGQLVNASGYEIMISNMDKQKVIIEKQIKEKRRELQALTDNGMSKNDPEYYEGLKYLNSMEEALGNIEEEQAKIEKQILEMPINHMETVLSMYDSITEAIQNWGNEIEASGKKLDATYYQSLINHGAEMINQYAEQAELIQDIMQYYDIGTDNWKELYDKLQAVNNSMSEMVKNLHEWNEELLKIPMVELSDYTNDLKKVYDGMTTVMSDYEKVISSVTTAIQDKIDSLKEENELTNKTYQDKIDKLQEQLDLLDKANEKRKLELALQRAQWELEKARTQKTNKEIVNGEITYTKDEEAERKALEATKDAEYDLKKYNLQEELNGVQEELDGINETYDKQIEKLEKISEKWSEIKENVDKAHDTAIADENLGTGWKDKILSGNDNDIYNMFKGMYESLDKQMTQYDEQITSTENIYDLLEEYIKSYKDDTITYETAMSGINNLLSKVNEKMSTGDNLQNILDYIGSTKDVEANADSVLTGIKDSFSESGEKLLKSLEEYNKNAGMITEYTSSWQQLTDNVSSMKDILEEVRDNLADTLDEIGRIREDAEEDDEDDSHYTTDGGRSPKHNDDQDNNHGPGFYADGIKKGVIGKNTPSQNVSLLKMLATEKLKGGAVPIIAHQGEVVLNQTQQAMLIDNYNRATYPFINVDIPDYSSLLHSNSNPISVNVDIGGITMNEVNSCDEFAKEIGDTFGVRMRQEVTKYLDR